MKILLISHNDLTVNPRGGERSSLEIINYLRDCGYDTTIKMWNDPNIENSDADIVLTWGRGIKPAMRLKEKFNIPYIAFVRAWTAIKRFGLEGLRKADYVITNCKEGSKRLKQFDINAVYSYVPILDKPIKKYNGKKILVIDKDGIYQVWEELVEKGYKREFIVIDHKLKTGIVEDSITFIPEQKDMESIWEQTAITLMPLGAFGQEISLGTGRIPIESMIRGIPCIVERGCGAEELNPFSVKKIANAKEWKKKIEYIFDNYAECSQLARKTIIERYDPYEELATIKGIIESIINKKQACMYISDGIGNIIEALHAVQAIKTLGYSVHVEANPTNQAGLELLNASELVDSVNQYDVPKHVFKGFDKYIACHRCYPFYNNCLNSQFDKTKPEREWHMHTIRELGYKNETPKIHLPRSQRYFDIPVDSVAMCIGAVNEQWHIKQWPYYEHLIPLFKTVVLVGASSDRPLPGLRYFNMDNVIDYIGDLSLLDTFSLISQCAMFIGNDGGLSHASANLGVKTFVIYGPTNSIKNLPMGAIAIQKNLDCQPCQLNSNKFMRCDDLKCMKQLKTVDVIREIKKHKELKGVLK